MMRPTLTGRETLLPTPQQARSIAKRRALLDAGRSLFAEKGYEATSIEDITSRAGTAAGAFYTYFRSKRQLLIVLMNDLLERLAATDLRPRQDLRTFLAGVFRTDLEYFGVIRAWQEATLTDPELGRMGAAIESWTETRLVGVLLTLRRGARGRARVDLRSFARMMDRYFWSLLARASTMSRRELDREIRMAADAITRYLLRE